MTPTLNRVTAHLRMSGRLFPLLGWIGLLSLAASLPCSGSESPASTAPVLDKDGAYVLAYKLLAKTKLGAKRVVFDPELKKVIGKKVTITGFVQPFEDAQDMWTFMVIQYPVGCWYCEAPGPLGILLVEMPEGKELENKLTMGAVKITGVLDLNEEDPNDFLYILTNAAVTRAK